MRQESCKQLLTSQSILAVNACSLLPSIGALLMMALCVAPVALPLTSIETTAPLPSKCRTAQMW